MEKFRMDNTQGYSQVELDELNYQFNVALENEINSWDHESEKYLDWQAGLSGPSNPEHMNWIGQLSETILDEYDNNGYVDKSDIMLLQREAGIAGDTEMVDTCKRALNDDEEALDDCRKQIFFARRED